MNDTLRNVFNYVCVNMYGGRHPDATMELEDPKLYEMFMEAFDKEDEKDRGVKYVWDEWTGGDKPPEGDIVGVIFRSGLEHWFIDALSWSHMSHRYDIVSYCIAVPDDV